jgi:probable HAF family extracellular repeat protein
MKPSIVTHIALMTLLTALVASLPLAGQNGNNLSSAPRNVHYVVKDLGTLGTSGVAEGISDRGWVTGDATLAGNQSVHAFLWRDGVMTDLDTLGGVNSQEQWPVKDNRGLIVGSSETAAMDPFAEDFCGFDANSGVPQTGLICLGFLWQGGVMTALPTLGGNNAQAVGVNDLGQVVGFAEQSTRYQKCSLPQVLDIQAVVWEPSGKIETLPPLPGDVSAWAIGINNYGQVIGASGDCVSPNFNGNGGTMPQHVVIWQHGTATNLKTLGGSSAFPWAINSRGQVAGVSNLAGDTNFHTFLWAEDSGMQDLKTLPGDVNSGAFGLNDQGAVVGGSCDVNFNCRAFLWENGVMTDLNSLVAPGSTPLYLVFGNDINSRGEIATYACLGCLPPGIPEFHAALAIPCNEQHTDIAACAETTAAVAQTTAATVTVALATSGTPRVSLPENVRLMLQRRLLRQHFLRPTPNK